MILCEMFVMHDGDGDVGLSLVIVCEGVLRG